MAITAKVTLGSKTLSAGGHVGLSFYADYSDGRNKEWASATPNLDLKMTVNSQVGDLFEVGTPYVLTFEKEVNSEG